MANITATATPDGVVPALRPFVDQWAARLTTYRQDGRPVHTPVNVAVADDRVLFRTYDTAWKCRRIDRDPTVELAPCDVRGRPTGAAVRGRARRLQDAPSNAAAAAIDAKYPLFQRVLIRLGHRLLRYRTVHYEVIPVNTDAH